MWLPKKGRHTGLPLQLNVNVTVTVNVNVTDSLVFCRVFRISWGIELVMLNPFGSAQGRLK
jgi:hypothetical protein